MAPKTFIIKYKRFCYFIALKRIFLECISKRFLKVSMQFLAWFIESREIALFSFWKFLAINKQNFNFPYFYYSLINPFFFHKKLKYPFTSFSPELQLMAISELDSSFPSEFSLGLRLYNLFYNNPGKNLRRSY